MDDFERQPVLISDDLLGTKLTAPRLHGALVPRSSLLARLDEGVTHKLTLISAPAGFGKTTLVSQWATERKYPLAWVALDAGDNDPTRFWRYVITACRSFDSAIGTSVLAALRMSQQPSFETFLIPFINELAQLPKQCVLVLEDYHAITSDEINQTVAFLLDHLPSTIHIVLLARGEPALPLARLRARNELTTLSSADLRFSPTETAAFLQQALHVSLSPEAINQLEQRTEGWVAGLRLLSFALQNKSDMRSIEQFLTTFTGGHRHILEYLVSEVLAAQPEAQQTFLLQTSFLSRLTGSLCDAVTGRSDSTAILQQLEHADLFLVPLGNDGQEWYRYQALFAEAMRHYTQQRLGVVEIRALHEKASLWHEEHNLLPDAVDEALAAEQTIRAVALIERLIETRNYNELYILRRWIEPLPESMLREHPSLCFMCAAAILFTSDRFALATAASVEKWLRMAEEGWRRENNDARLGQLYALRGLSLMWQDDLAHAFGWSRQALEFLAEDDVQYRGMSLGIIGLEELMAGNVNAALRVSLEARALCEAAQNIYGTLAMTSLLGEVYYQQGGLDQAVYYFRQVLDEAVGGDEMLDDQAVALTGLSVIAYERNDLQTAEENAARALELATYRRDESRQIQAELILARVEYASGQVTQAQQRLQTLIAKTRQPSLQRQVQAQLALTTGDAEMIQRWHSTVAGKIEQIPLTQQEREALIFARLQMMQGKHNSALDLLQGWRTDAHAQGRTRSEVEILCLIGLAHFAQSNMASNLASNLAQAEQAISRALSLGESFFRMFLDEGTAMESLLQAVSSNLTKRPIAAHVSALLRAFASGPMAVSTDVVSLLAEPLSQQEQRVLRLLVAGLSNPEIAQELIVSTNTIKTHVKNIYRKLGVSTREDARVAARELKLL